MDRVFIKILRLTTTKQGMIGIWIVCAKATSSPSSGPTGESGRATAMKSFRCQRPFPAEGLSVIVSHRGGRLRKLIAPRNRGREYPMIRSGDRYRHRPAELCRARCRITIAHRHSGRDYVRKGLVQTFYPRGDTTGLALTWHISTPERPPYPAAITYTTNKRLLLRLLLPTAMKNARNPVM